MKREISFGNIDYLGVGKNVNEVVVSIELHDDAYLSICADVWNKKHYDVVSFGQCLDYLVKHLGSNALFREIYDLWREYHLNDMKAGTRRQMEALERHHSENNSRYEYYDDCAYLESVGLLFDDLSDDETCNAHPEIRKGYRYGSGWLTWKIPEDKISRIKEIIAQ